MQQFFNCKQIMHKQGYIFSCLNSKCMTLRASRWGNNFCFEVMEVVIDPLQTNHVVQMD